MSSRASVRPPAASRLLSSCCAQPRLCLTTAHRQAGGRQLHDLMAIHCCGHCSRGLAGVARIQARTAPSFTRCPACAACLQTRGRTSRWSCTTAPTSWRADTRPAAVATWTMWPAASCTPPRNRCERLRMGHGAPWVSPLWPQLAAHVACGCVLVGVVRCSGWGKGLCHACPAHAHP